ncbi:MAG: hypothetical protein DI624_11155 [Brevundimonas sp.]|uniref:hypothetical protein n=1 Tax=Brevundimonas sp. TaxID=1871086 RepID=UPI000DB333D7|nr:hypothetical protein [uncultured Brevundimonas sp.]PZT97129.1 MAG: hypothetical protein DI624_11155 [Brevundimonas sp.]
MSVVLLSALMLSTAQAAPAAPDHAAPPPIALAGQAQTVRRYAADARQGVAVGPDAVYAVSNWSIVRYDKTSGEKQAEWTGDRARFTHINSCNLIADELVCASSNFPATPHVSTVETFDPVDLHHRRSIALGMGTGSITWIDRHDGSWWAMFANYDGRGGEAPRDHRHTTLVRFDDQWRRLEAWALPPSILERIAPMSVSGGGWGPDGRLYLTGHDLPELYVVALPMGGGVLDHVETLGVEAEGQAVDWDESQPGMLYGITRRTREILAMKVPQKLP